MPGRSVRLFFSVERDVSLVTVPFSTVGHGHHEPMTDALIADNGARWASIDALVGDPGLPSVGEHDIELKHPTGTDWHGASISPTTDSPPRSARCANTVWSLGAHPRSHGRAADPVA